MLKELLNKKGNLNKQSKSSGTALELLQRQFDCFP